MSRQHYPEDVVDYDRIPALIAKGRRERSLAMWSMLQKVFGRRAENESEGTGIAHSRGAPCTAC